MFAIGHDHRAFERDQSACAKHSAQKQSVGFKRPAYLHQCPGQIIRAVERACGYDKVKSGGTLCKAIFLGEGQQHSLFGLARQYPFRAAGQRPQEQAAFECPRRAIQPVGELVSRQVPKEMRIQHPVRRALSQHAAAAIVEYFRRGGRLHIALVPRPHMSDKTIMQALAIPFKTVVDFALPPRCPGCGAITPDQDQFCAGCWQQLHFLAEPACSTCDLPLPFASDAAGQCAACLRQKPRHAGIKAAVAYGDISREIALKLKHGGKIGLARLIAGMLRRHLHALPANALFVPVPLHWTRLWRRRYNQSALIARQLARLSGIGYCPDALLRTRRTAALGGLSARERAAMVKGAFAINERQRSRIKDRPIVLVDDVYTSGATSDACVAALRKAGAASVTIFCWARVLPAALEFGDAGEALT
jgi:ComF family protein